MAVTLTVNGCRIAAAAGVSLFDVAAQAGEAAVDLQCGQQFLALPARCPQVRRWDVRLVGQAQVLGHAQFVVRQLQVAQAGQEQAQRARRQRVGAGLQLVLALLG